MTTTESRDLLLRCLAEIAPDADLEHLDPSADLRRTLDLDSMDMFDLVAALAEGGGVAIPDKDIAQLTSLDAAAEYLAAAATG
jgi:acyl carrier protein